VVCHWEDSFPLTGARTIGALRPAAELVDRFPSPNLRGCAGRRTIECW
jgi:hypothetical protein